MAAITSGSQARQAEISVSRVGRRCRELTAATSKGRAVQSSRIRPQRMYQPPDQTGIDVGGR